MIVTELYKGQGLGNQLCAYVMTRVIALDKGYVFGIMHPERFKGASFITLDFGHPVVGGKSAYEGAVPSLLPHGITNYYCEARANLADGTDIRSYDKNIALIKDNTKIDGVFQGENYFKHRKNEIRQWIKVETRPTDPNLCIINFRGGEYAGVQKLFLAQTYWDNAIANMRSVNPTMEFQVVTDDVKTAKKFFPHFKISHNLKDDYIAIQSATYLILSNSSFAFFPAWLNERAKLIIAPKYWARHNVSDGYWSCGYNIVQGWMYQDRNGNLNNYEACIRDLASYQEHDIKDTSPIYIPPQSLRKKISRFLPSRLKKMLKKFL